MESEEDKKKLNDDLVVFMRKRSETDAPRYTARLKTYVDFKQKHRRAAAARRHNDYRHQNDGSAAKKKNTEPKEKSADNLQTGTKDNRATKRRTGEKCPHKPRSLSRSHSAEPVDACCRRRRRRFRKRKRSCRRRSRRRRRRSCGRRRRRSRSRRRRRRSCRRRRRRRRRCRR